VNNQNLERDLQNMEKSTQKQWLNQGNLTLKIFLENKRNQDRMEFQKGLQLQILEKRKAKDIDKVIAKQDLIVLK